MEFKEMLRVISFPQANNKNEVQEIQIEEEKINYEQTIVNISKNKYV